MTKIRNNQRLLTSSRSRRPIRLGFTLIEIIVVVTIIALLAGLIVPRIMGRVGDARNNKALADAKSLETQVTMYLLDIEQSRLDPDFELETLRRRADDGGGRNGPYLQKDDNLIDPWGTPYQIVIPGEVNTDFDIISAGEDKQFGNEDDITN
ncbi:MAG: type II secretion system protein GspG [Planctomycetota bacterium]|nr:type II secretion system protein GspG [Planctomycetota bacterium]